MLYSWIGLWTQRVNLIHHFRVGIIWDIAMTVLHHLRLSLFSFFLVLVSFAQGAAAEGSQTPLTDSQLSMVVLTVSYGDGSGRAQRSMTLGEMQALPLAGFETHTVWTEGVQRFEGVWLSDVVAELGIESGLLELSALNEYLVEFEVNGLAERRALVAYLHNGEAMSPRDKGPLWVVFPYDDGPEFQTEITYASSIWQLDRIDVLP